MSTSVRATRRGCGVRLIFSASALILASVAALTALLAITFAATGNLALAAADRPGVSDWRQAGANTPSMRPSAIRRDVVAAVAAERNRWDEAFDDAAAASLDRDDLKLRLAVSSSSIAPPSEEPAIREAKRESAPRQIAADQPVQMASLTPAAQPTRVATLETAPVPQSLTDADREAAAHEPVPEPVRLVPMATPRPADFARLAQPSRGKIVLASLGTAAPDAKESRPAALAYATPELEPKSQGPGDFFRSLLDQERDAVLPHRSKGIAIYDIASATVRLPNGEKLEAHSGLGHRQDNARYVREKNRGPTPPNVYDLRMREARFHGAEAIRLLPRNMKLVFNRDGLLAHPYMYAGGGDRSQSNGCVVFRDYGRFLRAFKAGEIAKLVVVPNMAELPTYMSAL